MLHIIPPLPLNEFSAIVPAFSDFGIYPVSVHRLHKSVVIIVNSIISHPVKCLDTLILQIIPLKEGLPDLAGLLNLHTNYWQQLPLSG